MKKCLCISLGYEGGCVLYANSLIKYFRRDMDVWISKSTELPCTHYSKRLFVKKGLLAQLLYSFLFLPYYLVLVSIQILRGRYEQVFVFGPHNWDIAFLWVFRLFGKKAYVVIHDGIMHIGERSYFHQLLMTFSMKTATNIVFLSDNVRTRVMEELKICKPSIIVPHGIINYQESKNITIRSLSSKPNLLMIGRINYYKGLSLIIDIASKLDFDKIGSLTIAGSFDKAQDLNPLRDNGKIKIIDRYLTENEFDSLIVECDFLLMPYLEATQSGIAAVSIGYAKPAIASRVGAMQEQFHETSAYFMDEVSSEELLKVINNAITDNELYLSKQISLLKQSKELDWRILSKKLCEYIDIN